MINLHEATKYAEQQPRERLVQMMQNPDSLPTGIPMYAVAAALTNRRRAEEMLQAAQGADKAQTTVAEDLVASETGGGPTGGGATGGGDIGGIGAMRPAPPVPGAPPTPAKGYAQGGVVGYAPGGDVQALKSMSIAELDEAERRGTHSLPAIRKEKTKRENLAIMDRFRAQGSFGPTNPKVDNQSALKSSPLQQGRGPSPLVRDVTNIGRGIGEIGTDIGKFGSRVGKDILDFDKRITDKSIDYVMGARPTAAGPRPLDVPPEVGAGPRPFDIPAGSVIPTSPPQAAPPPPTAATTGIAAGSAAPHTPHPPPSPNFPQIRQNAYDNAPTSPDHLSALRAKIDQFAAGQPDYGAERNQAINFGLMEAGLRIAGSRSPDVFGALGEAAPVVKSVGKELGGLRKEKRSQEAALLGIEADYAGALQQKSDADIRMREQHAKNVVDAIEKKDNAEIRRATLDIQGAQLVPPSIREAIAYPTMTDEQQKAFDKKLKAISGGRADLTRVLAAGRRFNKIWDDTKVKHFEYGLLKDEMINGPLSPEQERQLQKVETSILSSVMREFKSDPLYGDLADMFAASRGGSPLSQSSLNITKGTPGGPSPPGTKIIE